MRGPMQREVVGLHAVLSPQFESIFDIYAAVIHLREEKRKRQ